MSQFESNNNLLLMKYRIDLTIVKFRKIAKLILPARLTKWAQKTKIKKENISFRLLEDDYPWMSPNIWSEIVNFYRLLDSPVIIEFGTGASTINHFLEMTKLKRAQYIGIENDPAWFWLVVASIMNKSQKMGIDCDIKLDHRGQNDNDQMHVDVEMSFNNVIFLLKLRTSESEYCAAFDKPCDVIIVDGIERKQCVQKILQSNYLRTGGLMMLMEAGRGSDKWWEGKLYGDSDYSKEVEILLSFGGKFLNGTGVDNWPNCKRKSPRPTSYYCPLEACKLIKPSKMATSEIH
jgi:hypothetical protein